MKSSFRNYYESKMFNCLSMEAQANGRSPIEAWETFALDGCRSALKTVFFHYGDALYRFARSITESDDVAQTVVVKIFDRLASSSPSARKAAANPRLWLLRRVLLVCTQFRKSPSGCRLLEGPLEDRLDFDFRPCNVGRVETLRAAESGWALLRLPISCRVAIHLRYVEGLSTDDVCAITAWSEEDIFEAIREGLKGMRQSMARDGQHTNVADLIHPLGDLGSEAAPPILFLHLKTSVSSRLRPVAAAE